MTHRYHASEALFKKAKKLIPGGVNSPVRAFGSVGGDPIFFQSASGSIVTDADGNKLVDFCNSWGPLILGHAHPDVVQVAKNALEEGLTFGACSEREVILADRVLSAFPEYEQARFVSSGTEAVMTAVRLARGATGRNKIIKFDGCYHGHADHLLVKAGSGLITSAIASSAGVPDTIAGETLVAPLDDEQAVEALFSEYKNQIAAVIIEPLPANAGLLEQRKEYLNFLREITQANQTLLIFDEVITGFRLRFGGYMHEVGLVPDLVTLGKIVGGGMPVGALVGAASLMEQLAPNGSIYQAGTLSGNPVAMAAGTATLDVLAKTNAYEKLEQLGKVLDETLKNIQTHIPYLQSVRKGSIGWLYLDDGPMPRRAEDVSKRAIQRYNKHHRALLDRGFYLAPSAWEVAFLSTAHTVQQIKEFGGSLSNILTEA